MLNLIVSFDEPVERLLYGEPDPWLEWSECRVLPGPRGGTNNNGNRGEPGGSATLSGPRGSTPQQPTGSPHDPDNNPPPNDGGSTPQQPTPQQPTGSPVGTDPGEQTPDNTIPSGTDPSTLPDGEYYDSNGHHVIVTTSSNGYTSVREAGEESGYHTRPDGTILTYDNDGSGGYTPPGLDNPSLDNPTPFSRDPHDDRTYVVTGDGQVAYYQNGNSYRVSDDDLADAVRDALDTGDASGLSSVDRVSVYDAGGQLIASNYQRSARLSGNSAETTERLFSESTSVDEQEEWFRDQVRNLPADPAQAAQRLSELAAIAANLGQRWSGRDAGAFVDGQGNPVTPQNYFANLAEILSASATANQDIAQANAGLPPAPADPAVGRRFEADRDGISVRLREADAIDDPAQRAAVQAAVVADLRDLQQRWANTDTRGWSFTVEDGQAITAAGYWQEWANGVEQAVEGNRDAAERTAASQQAVADFNAAVAPGALSPADYARLAEQWRQRPDNALVQVPVADPALAEGGGAVYQTPAGYFARLSGDPHIIAAEEQRERERRILPGETGGVGTQVAVDPITGTLQVSPGVAAGIEQQQRYNAVAGVNAGGVGDLAAQAGIEQQQRYNAAAGVNAGGVGDLAVQAGIEQQQRYNAAAGVNAGGVGDLAVQAGIEQQQRYNAAAGVNAGGVGDLAAQAGIEQQQRYNAAAGVNAGGVGDLAAQAGIEQQQRYNAAAGVNAGGVGDLAAQAGIEQQQRYNAAAGVNAGGVGDLAAQAGIEQQQRYNAAAGVNAGGVGDLAAQAGIEQQQRRQNEDLLSVIRGDLTTPITADDVKGAIARIAVSRNEEAGSGTTADGAGLDAQAERYGRTAQDGPRTLEDIQRASPQLSEDEAKEQLAFQTVLDIYNETQNPSIGSFQLTSELRRRGMNLADANRYAEWTVNNGLGTYNDRWALGGAVVGGIIGANVAPRLIPVITRGINPRLTTGVLRGGVEEIGEEAGELIADVIATAVIGGNPLAILLDPTTYAYAGGSILFSSVTEADSPGVRPRPDAVPDGAVGAGAVHSLQGRVDPAVAAEGNRLLDRRAASRQELDKYLNEPRPEGADPATWNARGRALARDVSNADAALTDFRLQNPNLVVGYKSGGTLTATTATNLIAVVPPDGNIRIYTLPPGEATFVPAPTETPNAPTPDQSGPDVLGHGSTLGVVESPSLGNSQHSGTSGVDGNVRISRIPKTAVPSPSPQVTPSPAPAAVAPSPILAPIPTAALQREPLVIGQATTAAQQQTTPTQTSPQPASLGRGAAPPEIATPTPNQPSPQAAPQASPQPSPIITPTPPREERSETEPDARPGLPATSPLAPPSPFIQPLITPSTLTTPMPGILPQPLAISTFTAQPTVTQPAPSPSPTGDPQPDPQPNPRPGLTPTVPTITPNPQPGPEATPKLDFTHNLEKV